MKKSYKKIKFKGQMHNIIIRKLLLMFVFSLSANLSFADDSATWAPGINTGDQFPAFNLITHEGNPLSLETLTAGNANGYLIQFNRSVVW